MWRKVLVGVGLFIAAILGLGFFLLNRIETKFQDRQDAQLKTLEPKVLVDDTKFIKRNFCKSSSIGRVTQIIAGGLGNDDQTAFTLVSNYGVHYVAANGEVKRTTKFANAMRSFVERVQLDRAGSYGFLTRDQSWASDVILLNESGAPLWNYSRGGGIDDSSVAEAGENGKSTFVVGFNGGGGIVLLDSQGKEIWKKPEANVWHVESLDVDGDGHREILNSNARGELLVRNMAGNIENRYLSGYYVAHFSLTRWGDEPTAKHILVPATGFNADRGKKVLVVLDAKGTTVATLSAIPGDWSTRAAAVPIRGTTEPLFAVVQTGNLPRSVLSVYNAKNSLVYREVLGEFCSSLNTRSVDSKDKLFLGCDSSVWEYDPADQPE
jgi:hypothetical protein